MIKGVDTTLYSLNIEMEQDSPVEYVEWLDSPTVPRDDGHSDQISYKKIGLDSISERNESYSETNKSVSMFSI